MVSRRGVKGKIKEKGISDRREWDITRSGPSITQRHQRAWLPARYYIYGINNRRVIAEVVS